MLIDDQENMRQTSQPTIQTKSDQAAAASALGIANLDLELDPMTKANNDMSRIKRNISTMLIQIKPVRGSIKVADDEILTKFSASQTRDTLCKIERAMKEYPDDIRSKVFGSMD